MNTHHRLSLSLALGIAISGISTLASAHHDIAGARYPLPGLALISELPPDLKRRCIPGPHEIGRTRRLSNVATTSAASWSYSRNVDAFPHCRYDSQEAADRAARFGE